MGLGPMINSKSCVLYYLFHLSGYQSSIFGRKNNVISISRLCSVILFDGLTLMDLVFVQDFTKLLQFTFEWLWCFFLFTLTCMCYYDLLLVDFYIWLLCTIEVSEYSADANNYVLMGLLDALMNILLPTFNPLLFVKYWLEYLLL